MIYRILLAFAIVSSCDSSDKDVAQLSEEPVFEIENIAALDSSLTESSGLIYLDGKLYTHSDIAGVADLLELKLDGTIEKVHSYDNVLIKDWEDITSDDNFIYIADIGNNLAARTDLQIYKVKRSQLNNSRATAESIRLSFNDQTDFGNGEYNKTNFDAEAITIRNGDIYLFTKNWLDLETNIYKISTEAGNYPSDPLANLDLAGLVTGATTDGDGNIVVCGYSPTLSPFIALITFENDIPKLERKIDITGTLQTNAQIEGITYAGSTDGISTFYLTSEQFTRSIAGQQIEFPAALFELKWRE